MDEDAARELPKLPLEDALMLVHLYAARGSPKFEKAAMRWLERYLDEGSPSLGQFAKRAEELVVSASWSTAVPVRIASNVVLYGGRAYVLMRRRGFPRPA
jgi:hypothetical protein